MPTLAVVFCLSAALAAVTVTAPVEGIEGGAL